MTDPSARAERLAALLDGRVDADRRAAILAEVADSEEVAAVLADAAAVLRELEADGVDAGQEAQREAAADPARDATTDRHAERPAPTVMSLPPTQKAAPGTGSGGGGTNRDRGTKHWLWRSSQFLAAAVVLFALVPMLRRGEPTDTPAGAFDVRLSAETRHQAAMEPPPAWSTMRSGQAVLSPETRAARLGVRLADLQLAVERGDTTARALAGDIALLLSDMSGGAPLVAHYRSIAASPAPASEERRELLRTGREAVLTAVGPDAAAILAAAAWARLGQSAATAGDRAFLADPRGRALLARARDAIRPDEAAGQAMGRLSPLLGDDAVSVSPAALRQAFDEVLDALTR